MVKSQLIKARLEVIELKVRAINVSTEPFVHAPLGRFIRLKKVIEHSLDLSGICLRF